MPGQKRKYSVRFPPGRIKKIMQKDTEVGRIATAVPVIISQALEMFLKSLLTKTCQITKSKHSRVMSITHVKQCIETEKLFDFLKELAEHATMTTKREGRGKGLSIHSHRRKCQEMSVSQQNHVEKKPKKANQDTLDNPDSSTDVDSEMYICLGASA
ncbi:dr1-associated corepressor [Esox lucius]|uniref:Dr1-associated corepressor n=1 Tax=Esox lucius TaxID=8010 RepID=A0A3P9AN20_ESOLU|nr:dr1-associated corepressor [Esox lucius]